MSDFKVLVTRRWPESVEKELKENFDTTLSSDDIPLSNEALSHAMGKFDALLPTVTDKITDQILSSPNKRVKIIGNFGVGFNNIDIDSAKKK